MDPPLVSSQAEGSNALPTLPSPAHIPSRSYENLWDSCEDPDLTLGPQCGIIYHDPADDAISRHQIQPYCSHSESHCDECEQNYDQLAVRYASTDPGRTRSLSLASTWSYTRSAPSLHPKHNSFCSINQAELYELVDHGPTAIEEEDEALEHSAQLAAARVLKSKSMKSSIRVLSIRGGTTVGPKITQDPGVACDEEEHGIEDDDEEDDDEDCCLSGLCLPRSQFFQTSIICSNTMARDGFANERTFLSWLSSSTALCVVSLTFMSRSFSLDAISPDTNNSDQKDRLSRTIGYVCFISALLTVTYSLLKYLRNIRRISTRYPFAQAGKWTFTVGMFIGSLIMLVLVLTYTRHL